MSDQRPRDPQRVGLTRALTNPLAMVAAIALALFAVNYVSGIPAGGWGEDMKSTAIEARALNAAFPGAGTGPPKDPAALSFGPIHFAGHSNYVLRNNVTSAQIVVSETTSASSPLRFIAAFPNGNTGVLASFLPLSSALRPSSPSSQIGVSLKSRTLDSMHHPEDDQRGLVGELTFSGDVSLDLVLLGSVRTLRDYVEGNVLRDIFQVELSGYKASDSPGEGEVWLSRQWINGSTVSYLGLFAADNNTVLSPRPSDSGGLPSVNITRLDPSRNTTVRFECTFNFTSTTPPTRHVPLQGLGMDQLFVTSLEGGDYEDVVRAIRGPAKEVVDQLAFLAYESEFLAGGWRFLTYFGRDTLLAMQVLLPVLSPTAAEAILAGVIQRTGPTGELCHEETIGDYASALHIHEGRPELGNIPEYDYKMVDTDFLLLPVLSRYAEAHPTRIDTFMRRNSTLVPGYFHELVKRNADHVLELATPFATDLIKENLIGLRAWPLGNWRDSPAGNGWGHYPFDVNCAMVPAALRAISSLVKLGVLPAAEYAHAAAQADIWETHGCAHFGLPIVSSDAEARLFSYVKAANLSTSLLYGAGSLNDTQTVSADKTYGWTDLVVGDSTLYALALTAEFQHIAVQHSDLCFALLNSPSVPPAVIQATLEAMQPYPRGLLTNTGMLVANAAYDTNASAVHTFANTAYHGAVAWSWQQAFMAAGIEAQLNLCQSEHKPPEWCATLGEPLRQAQTRLWDSIAGSRSVLWTEVWTPIFRPERGVFEIGDLGEISSDGSEGDAIQLWSYAFLGLTDPRTGRPVAEGF